MRYFVIVVLMLSISTESLNGQTSRQGEFSINDFVVNVISITSETQVTGLNPRNFRPFLESHPDISFAGTGTINFKGRERNVSFSGVKVRLNQRNQLIATSGQVRGTSVSIVNYDFAGFKISINWKSVIIKPSGSTAIISVKVPLHSCASDSLANLNMISPSCQFFSDGSVFGNNFSGSGVFSLKKSVYSVHITNQSDGIIKIGRSLNNTSPENGAHLKAKDQNNLFDISCSISEDPSNSKLIFRLLNPVEKHLEYNTGKDEYYFVKLKKGMIRFRYDADTLTECRGEFPSKVKLPARYNRIVDIGPGEVIDTFDVMLLTDYTNALFDSLDLVNHSTGRHYQLKIGAVSFDPGKYKAWIYFPKWLENSSEYSIFKGDPACEELSGLLRRMNNGNIYRCDKNPGLTVTRGTMYLMSPQIDYKYSGSLSETDSKTVKTYFSGYLTFTPYGLQGSVGSDGNTFVPFTYSMNNCSINKSYSPSSWKDIISKGDTLPEKIDELFRIQKLKILEMRMEVMFICKDKVVTKSSFFRYFVHFPYPTYMNLEFEDNSFSQDGTFSNAYGPIALRANENLDYRTSVIMTDEEKGRKKEAVQVPSGYIFWAWRLPVIFADRGIEIDYRRLFNYPDSGITITMNDQSRNSIGEIYGSELSVSPLYSDNSAFRKGVRFKGFLSSEGAFHLVNWDTKPYFGKSYSKKFRCDLSDISLAPLGSSPTMRPFDFNWNGRLQFPFFCYNATETWRLVQFQVKDAEPFMPMPIGIERTVRQRLGCDSCTMTSMITDDTISFTVDHLEYDEQLGGFVCDRLRKNGTDKWGRLELFSYAHALFIENNITKKDTILKRTEDNSCNNNKIVIEKLKDAYLNKNGITDLVCYDPLASLCRNPGINNSSCCDEFYYGTYEIITYKSSTDSTITLSATNAKFYPHEPVYKLNLENSTLAFRSDDTSQGTNQIINVPGMQLASTDQGYFGAFGSTYTDVAFSLPYEGEFRFFLDPHCGYFYMLGAGSFTIFGIPLRGQVFLFHAPKEVFYTHPFTSYNTTSLLEDMSIRSLSADVSDFLGDTQLSFVDQGSVVTGFLSTGAASYGLNWHGIDVSIKAGITNYLFHSSDGNTFRTGMFGVVGAEASIDVILFSVHAEGRLKLALALGIPFGNYDNVLVSLKESDFILQGEFMMKGCVGVFFLGNCCAGFRSGATLSNENGLEFDAFDLFSCCDCDN